MWLKYNKRNFNLNSSKKYLIVIFQNESGCCWIVAEDTNDPNRESGDWHYEYQENFKAMNICEASACKQRDRLLSKGIETKVHRVNY